MVEDREHGGPKLGTRRYLPQICAAMVKNILLLGWLKPLF